MADPSEISERALEAVRTDDPEEAARRLRDVLALAPDRIDIVHALAVAELRAGRPAEAMVLTHRAEDLARARADEAAAQMMGAIHLVRGAAAEDLALPANAEAAYREILAHEPGNPRARQALGHLLLAWGRLEDGLDELGTYLEERLDSPEYIDATKKLVEATERFAAEGRHPELFLEAHRAGYVDAFDRHAARVEAEGWIAEAAHMRRAADGSIVPVVPEGARPYAAVRVDLVDPATGRVGRVGEGPMLVAIEGFEPLAQAPVLYRWPEGEWPFAAWVSSQVPWNHLVVQVAFRDAVEIDVLDEVIGEWYTAGFEGRFGEKERGRFHEIGDPLEIGPGRFQVHLDAGRAEVDAVPDLLERLAKLHRRAPLAHVVLGRGFLPA